MMVRMIEDWVEKEAVKVGLEDIWDGLICEKKRDGVRTELVVIGTTG